MRAFFQRHVIHNFTLKLISLALAAGLWLAVARDPVAEVGVDVPIEFDNISPSMEISSENIPHAQIRLRGPEHAIRRLQPSDVYAEVDLHNLHPGERTFDLTVQQIHHPADLEVVQVVPSELHLAFDERLVRQVTVQPRVTGAVGAGYGIARIVVEPSTIVISGPKRQVEAVQTATTDPMDVSGAVGTLTFSRHPYVSDPMVQVADSHSVRVTVVTQKLPTLSNPSKTE